MFVCAVHSMARGRASGAMQNASQWPMRTVTTVSMGWHHDNTWKFHITALVTVAISSSESSFGRSSLLFAHTTIRTAWQLDKSSFASIISSRIATTVADKISSFALLNDDNCKLIKWAKKPLCGWHRRQQYHIHVDNRHNNHSPYPLWYPIKFMTG